MIPPVKPKASFLPIRSLGPSHRDRIAAHLLALGERDRYLRFGYPASDAHIQRYVDGLNLGQDDVLGIFNRKLELIAMAHIAYTTSADGSPWAEFGVSVAESARGRGYGARLFERAAMHCRNQGVDLMYIHALSENTAMLAIARKAGAKLERDGSETDAFLRLPPASFDSMVSEFVGEQLAQTDYQLKAQAQAVRQALSFLDHLRFGAEATDDRTSA